MLRQTAQNVGSHLLQILKVPHEKDLNDLYFQQYGMQKQNQYPNCYFKFHISEKF